MKRIAILGGVCLLVSMALAGSAPALSTGHALSTEAAMKAGANARALALVGNPQAFRVLKAPASTCAGADDPSAPISVQETAMKCLVNYARQQAGLPRLADTRKLNVSALNKSTDILRCNRFSHEACGRDFLFWFRRAGYIGAGCWWAGENLAWGSGPLGSARSIMKAWLRSASHRANILASDYSEFGLSLRVGSLSGSDDAHVWVNHFGRHC